MRVFLGGIMQGSHINTDLHEQGYRPYIIELFAKHLPEAEVYDPLAGHQSSVEYDDEQGKAVFHRHLQMCRDFDVTLAFLPQASMGTAIEMWEARQANRCVVSISPLTHNWVVRFFSDLIYPDLESFEQGLASGEFAACVAEKNASPRY